MFLNMSVAQPWGTRRAVTVWGAPGRPGFPCQSHPPPPSPFGHCTTHKHTVKGTHTYGQMNTHIRSKEHKHTVNEHTYTVKGRQTYRKWTHTYGQRNTDIPLMNTHIRSKEHKHTVNEHTHTVKGTQTYCKWTHTYGQRNTNIL